MNKDITSSLNLDSWRPGRGKDKSKDKFKKNLFISHRHELQNGVKVAITQLEPVWSVDERRRRMQVLREIWLNCSHRNVVELLGWATWLEDTVIVYEWHKYGGVVQYLRAHRKVDPYELSAQISNGVAYLHANNITHGCISGDHVLFSEDGVPRLHLSVWTCKTPMIAATQPSYIRWMAPELFKEGSQYTLASDIYALGMTILEAITLKVPFHYRSSALSLDLKEEIQAGALPLRETDVILENEAGNMIWDILCKCWSFQPADRPTAGEVSEAVSQVYQTLYGVTLKSLRLKVGKDTSIQDLVAHYKRRGLKDYTDILKLPQANFPVLPISDTQLANVYKFDLPENQCVAVKYVKHEKPYKKLKRAAREFSCWSTYTHENILPVLGFAVFQNSLAMVSPWMNHGYVTEYVIENPKCDRLLLCTQLTKAVAYLHKQNVVHGDIKGRNVLISDTDTVQVTDFGVSIAEHQEIEFSQTSIGRGSIRYQAPEILSAIRKSSKDGNKSKPGDSSKEGDVYALSMTILEIYTGEEPYSSIGWSSTTPQMIVEGLRPNRPSELMLPKLDAKENKVWELMTKCWVGAPKDRPSSSEVYEQLRRI